MKEYRTDIASELSDLLRRKAEGRRDIVRRSFGEKIAMMEALRERLAPFKKAREQRRYSEGAGTSTSSGEKT
jgi:hypothetical protein